MEEWLCETVGLSSDRASLLAHCFSQVGLVSLEDFISPSYARKNWMDVLEIEIEEWEAVALASAINSIARGDSLVSEDQGIYKCLAAGCQNSVVNQQACMTTWEALLNSSKKLAASSNHEKLVSMQEMITTVYNTHASSSAHNPNNYEYYLNTNASIDSRADSSEKHVLLTVTNLLMRSKSTPLLMNTYALLTALVHQQPTHQNAVCTIDLLETMALHLSTYSMNLPLVSKVAMLLEVLIFQNHENCARIVHHHNGRLLELLAHYYTQSSTNAHVRQEQQDQFSSFLTHVLNIYVNITENEDSTILEEIVAPDSTCMKNLMYIMNKMGDKYLLLTESFISLISCLLKASIRKESNDKDAPEISTSVEVVVHSSFQSDNGIRFCNMMKAIHRHGVLKYLVHVFHTHAVHSTHLFASAVTCVNIILSDPALLLLTDDTREVLSDTEDSSVLLIDVRSILDLSNCYIDLLSRDVYVYFDHYSVFIEMYQTFDQLLCLYQAYVKNKYPKAPHETYVYDPSNSANPLDRHLLYYHFPSTKSLLLTLTHLLLKKFPANAKYADEIVCIYYHYLNIIRLLLRDCSEVYIALCRDILTNVVSLRNTLYLDTHITSSVGAKEKQSGRIESDQIFQALIAVMSTLNFQYTTVHSYSSENPSAVDDRIKLGNAIASLCVHFFKEKSLLGLFMNHPSNVFMMLVTIFGKSFANNAMRKLFYANNFYFDCLLQCLQHGPAFLLNTPNHPLCALYMSIVQSLYDSLTDVDPGYSNDLLASFKLCLQGLMVLCSHGAHIKVLLDDLHMESPLLGMLIKLNSFRGVSAHQAAEYRQPSDERKAAEGSVSLSSPRTLSSSPVRVGHSSSIGMSSPNMKKHTKRVSFIDTDTSQVVALPAVEASIVVERLNNVQSALNLFNDDQLHVITSLIIKCLSNICNEHNFVYTSCLVKGGVVKYAIQCLQAYGKESVHVTLACLDLCSHLAVDNKISLGEYGMCEALSEVFCYYVPLVEVDEGYLVVDSFALDEHLVSVLCKTIYVLCDSYVANKARIKEYGSGKVLKVLQLLIGKYFYLVANPVRSDVTDALNVIKFMY
eukprot:gene27301-32976_t